LRYGEETAERGQGIGGVIDIPRCWCLGNYRRTSGGDEETGRSGGAAFSRVWQATAGIGPAITSQHPVPSDNNARPCKYETKVLIAPIGRVLGRYFGEESDISDE